MKFFSSFILLSWDLSIVIIRISSLNKNSTLITTFNVINKILRLIELLIHFLNSLISAVVYPSQTNFTFNLYRDMIHCNTCGYQRSSSFSVILFPIYESYIKSYFYHKVCYKFNIVFYIKIINWGRGVYGISHSTLLKSIYCIFLKKDLHK